MDLADEMFSRGKYYDARGHLQRAVQILERLFGKDHLELGVPVQRLAMVTGVSSTRQAVPLFVRSVEIFKKHLGTKHPAYVAAVTNLGVLYEKLGEKDKAKALLLEALSGVERDSHTESTVLMNLASVYTSTEQYGKAEELLLRSAHIRRTLHGETSTYYGRVVENLGVVYMLTGRDKEAELFLTHAARIAAAAGNAIDTGLCLHNLAYFHVRHRQFDKAEPLLVKAVQLFRRVESETVFNQARSLSLLGRLYQDSGQHKEAEAILIRTVELLKVRHEDSALYAGSVVALALLRQTLGQPADALALSSRGLEAIQKLLDDRLLIESEATVRMTLAEAEETRSLEAAVNLALAQKDSNPQAVHAALTWVLRRKSMILDGLIRSRETQLLIGRDEAVADQAARLRSLRQELSNLPLRPQVGGAAAQLREETRLREQSDLLEAELKRTLLEKLPRMNFDAVSVNSVRAQLKPGAALVEFVRAPAYDFKAAGDQTRWLPPRYFAFVLRADAAARPQILDLGAAAVIDDAVRALRAKITSFKGDWKHGLFAGDNPLKSEDAEEASYRAAARALGDLVFAPVRRELAEARSIFLAPDGQLNLLPFEALADAEGKYLVETYRFTYLSGGRDLLRGQAGQGQGAVAFIDPDFDANAPARAEQAKAALSAARRPPAGGNSAEPWTSAGPPDAAREASRAVRGGSWDRIRSSAEEIKYVSSELRATVYSGPQALEEVFKRLQSPRLLHVSTHGFFPEESATPESAEAPLDLSTGSAALVGQRLLGRVRRPLLQSGLVLAGANRIAEARPEGVDDGWVTAEEIAMMDLRGTDLVTLSACGTGLGTVASGEGVYGLRRAFQLAGARSIISTLFEVPDVESGELTRAFFAGLKAGKGKLDALRDAQLDVLRGKRGGRKGSAHPFYWAGFVLSGDPR